jgi:hypothetical protein
MIVNVVVEKCYNTLSLLTKETNDAAVTLRQYNGKEYIYESFPVNVTRIFK